MLALYLLICLSAADAPAMVEAALLAGGPVTLDRPGPLRGGLLLLSDTELVVSEADGPRRTLPLEQVLSIDFTGRKLAAADAPVRVVTTDGSRFLCKSYSSNGKLATFQLVAGGEFTVDEKSILGVLLKPAKPEDAAKWLAKAIEKRTSDVLGVNKEGRRADLEGIVGPIGLAGLKFHLDGEEVMVKTDRIESILYAHEFQPREGRADVVDVAGNFWVAGSVQYAAGVLLIRTPAGAEVRLPARDVIRVHFARGRLMFLSDLDPTVVEHVPFFDRPWEYRRDVNFDQQPIRLHGVEYAKGLVVHSRTALEYPLTGKYRRFESLVGIEDSAGSAGDAVARVLGDGKILWEGRVRARAAPLQASCSVEGIRSLRIEVDYGENLDLGDHVAWAEARVVK